ncbi:hypothetical protein CspHIS471_0609660 [Cutaneotrichosporon sp. HIS471]|nr:hypothetical protein CspHIS471_0609660 [Cutaneotrichosporon sp. HIS471]
MPAGRHWSSPTSTRPSVSTDVSPIPSSTLSDMNVSTSTENDADDEATTPTAPSHPHPWGQRSVSAQVKQPHLSHRISVGSSLRAIAGPSSASPYRGRGRPPAPSSLPSSGWAGPQRDFLRPHSDQTREASPAATTVSPQNDYLPDWESLQDLVMPVQDDANHTPSRHRDSSVGSRRSGYGSLDTPVRATRTVSSHLPRVPSVTETNEESDEDVAQSSYFAAGDDRPSIVTMAQPRVASPLPPVGAETPSGGHQTPVSPSAAAKKPQPSRWSWTLPPYWAPVFKCGLAYLIASLFTFVPQLSRLLSMQSKTDSNGRTRPVPSHMSHLVSTIVLMFIPARTMGNMILSTRYCLTLTGLAVPVSLLSFGIVRFFNFLSPSDSDTWDWANELSGLTVCVVCVGGSLTALAWLKQWVNNPSFNSGSSLAAIVLLIVVVREGGVIQLKEVFLIMLVGVTITNVVCFTVKPVSATTRLQGSMTKSLDGFSTLLDILCSTFLLEQPHAKKNRMPLAQAVKAHGAAFKSLNANLAEAKHESLIDPRMRGVKLELYNAAIGSMARLAQHLAAMRSSTRLQEALLRANRDGRIDLAQAEKRSHNVADSVIYELGDLSTVSIEEEADVEQSLQLFHKLQRMTGGDMDRLVGKCDEALDAIEEVFGAQSKEDTEEADVPGTRAAVAEALSDFTRSSGRAIKRIYAGPRRRESVYDSDNDSSSSDEGQEPQHRTLPLTVNEDDDDGPNEVIFLVYFFLFTMEEFARELLFLLGTVNEIIDSPLVSAWDQLRSIIAPWRKSRRKKANFLYKQFQKLVPMDPSKLQPPLFPKTQRDERGTLLTPARASMSFRQRLSQFLWELGTRLSEPDLRYAIKTGLGGAILAAPAFAETTRPFFIDYHGEWALITYFGTMSKTVGQTNFLSFIRTAGTIMGGVVAVIACQLFPFDPVALPLFGFLFSLPCFYIITQMPEYRLTGIFVLLTYNLTCLYSYNLRDKALSPVTIALKRTACIGAGVVWAAFVTRWWWPFTARRELRMGLGDFFLDLSYLYSRLVTTYTRGAGPTPGRTYESDSSDTPELPTERTALLPPAAPAPVEHHLSKDVLQFMAMEIHLQGQLGELRGLLGHAKNEPRLKGPFASAFYHEVLLSCERMLDRLHSMRCVATRSEWDQSIRQAFVLPVNRQQREMAGSIILYFYTLSAGFRLRLPMPPYLPPAEDARERLVDAIRQLDVVKRRSVSCGGRHLLFFAYALAMQEVINELDYLGGLLQDAFGVIATSSGVREFDELFVGGPGDGDEHIHDSHLAFDSSFHFRSAAS